MRNSLSLASATPTALRPNAPDEGTTNAQGRLDLFPERKRLNSCQPVGRLWRRSLSNLGRAYLLRDLVVEPGAQRILFLIGDTPSVEVTAA